MFLLLHFLVLKLLARASLYFESLVSGISHHISSAFSPDTLTQAENAKLILGHGKDSTHKSVAFPADKKALISFEWL